MTHYAFKTIEVKKNYKNLRSNLPQRPVSLEISSMDSIYYFNTVCSFRLLLVLKQSQNIMDFSSFFLNIRKIKLLFPYRSNDIRCYLHQIHLLICIEEKSSYRFFNIIAADSYTLLIHKKGLNQKFRNAIALNFTGKRYSKHCFFMCLST